MTVRRAGEKGGKDPVNPQTVSPGREETAAGLKACLEKLQGERFAERLWQKDGSLWRADPREQEALGRALGWLDVVGKMEQNLADLVGFAQEVRGFGFSHVVHMGMGGSSLAPIVFQHMFQPGPEGLPLIVLDTTDPATVAGLEQRVALATTLFIVASKSGTTAEPLAFDDYFYDRVKALKGERAGENFVAITDSATPLAESARQRGFRRTFLNPSDIGGRYSALSYFGLLPAALMGLDVGRILAGAAAMARACGPSVPASENPGMVLGAAMGEMARTGRDKVTFLLPVELATLGMWLEQLIAESTGKEGKGILPVAGETCGSPSAYGNDRLFVSLQLKGHGDPGLEEGVRILKAADQPLIAIELHEESAIGQEFFRWEVATAVAGAVLGIDPFDQPNVQESKDATNRFLRGVAERGSLKEPAPGMVHGPLSFFTANGADRPEHLLSDFFSQANPGDYISLQAYLTEEAPSGGLLQAIRLRLRDGLRLATTIGYGPRFLHSTGQLHKGGPPTGLFIQLTCRDAIDVSIPGRPYTFGIFKKAQALGDLEALQKHRRRVMRIDLGDDARKGLTLLRQLVERAVPMGPKGA
jgi:glucose-6-phosphate isomerase